MVRRLLSSDMQEREGEYRGRPIGDTEPVLMIEVAIKVHGDLVWRLINQCRTTFCDRGIQQ